MKYPKYLLSITIFCILCAISSLSHADDNNAEAGNFAKNLIDNALKILNDPNLSDAGKNTASKDLLSQNLDDQWMGDFVLGQHKRTISPEEKTKFLDAYKNFVLSYFSKNFASFKGSSVSTKSIRETSENEYVVTCESVKSSSQETSEVQVMIRKKDNKFLVFDFLTAGVSFITAQRAEYHSIISEKGIEFMTEHLKSLDKVSQFEQKTNVEVFTASYCPYCKTAKEFLSQHNIRFREIDITDNLDERNRISKISALKTVPQIFVDGKFVSDCSGLFEIEKQGNIHKVFLGS